MLNRSGPGLRSVLSRIVLATVAVVAVVAAGCDTDTPTAPTSLSNGTQAPEIRRVAIDDTLGAVGGMVFDDANQDGIKDEGETGVMDVNVVLADPTGKTVGAKTDEAGNYLFDDLEPAFYIVSVEVPEGYALTTSANVQVKVNAAEMAMVDHGLYMEETGGDVGSVMGTVYDDANQNGMMDEGEMGLEGLTVGLIDGTGTASDAMTDADGKYSFADLMPGDYTVVAPMVEGWMLTTPDSVAVTVVADMAEMVDFGLYMEDTGGDVGSVMGTVYDDANQNGMMDEGEMGLEGLTVGLIDGTGTASDAMTDADGKYSFADLMPGDYTVVAPMVEGWMLTTPDSVAVTVVADMAEMVDFGLYMEDTGGDVGSVMGKVFDDANGNGMMDEGEMGLEGLDVGLIDPTGKSTGAKTDADGMYSFMDLLPGDYTVVGPMVEGWTLTTADSVMVKVAADMPVMVDFGLMMDEEPCEDTGISGVIYEDLNGNGMYDEGEPGIGGVEVRLSSRNNPRNEDTRQGSGIHRYATSGEDGSYVFEDVRPGDWRVMPKKPHGYHRSSAKDVEVSLEECGAADDVDFGFSMNGDDDDGDDE